MNAPLTPVQLRRRVALVAGTALAALIGIWFAPRIPQDPRYHDFADRREWLGIPNFGDVVSNFPFCIAGAAALWWLTQRYRVGPGRPFLTVQEKRGWVFVFVGIFLTGIGSAYYHWEPTTDTLFWDRLPMTLGFMGLLGVQIMERVSVRSGSMLLVPLVVLGVMSVLSWHQSEFHGIGDLRLYALVQFYPLLAIPLMLALFPPRYDRGYDILLAFGWYLLAKVTEWLDVRIFAWLGHTVSGHTIKHLAAAAGSAWLFRMLLKRRAVVEAPPGLPVDLQ